MDNGLRFTDTNSADDSKGSVWGLDGFLYIYLLAGAMMSVALLLFLFSAMRNPLLPSAMVAAIPLLLGLIYIFGFRQGKPPAYDQDVFERWIIGDGFGPNPHLQPQHPLRGRDDS